MNRKMLYLDCSGGISGDMLVAALLDLGADREALDRALSGIEGDHEICISRVKKMGLDCCDFDVRLSEPEENHDHDMEYLFGHDKSLAGGHEDGGHDHHHDSGHQHHHEDGGHQHHHEDDGHDHHHDHHDHHHDGGHDHHHEGHHHHRNLGDVENIISSLDMTEGARALALKTFTILASAEAKAHGSTPREVHFHEVGAIDSIVDIVAAAVCFDSLGIERVAIPALGEGSGTVRCAHGILPIPVPAVMNIAGMHCLPITFTGRKGELITPTGAALAAALITDRQLPEVFIPERTGLGAGKRAYEIPSILRAVIIRDEGGKTPQEAEGTGHTAIAIGKDPPVTGGAGTITKLECNMDDIPGEALGYTLERLMASGARDAYFIPVYMKKNRPGVLLTVICDEADRQKLEDIIFSETTTLGIRRIAMERTVLERSMGQVMTEAGAIDVKYSFRNGAGRGMPEYESVRKAALSSGRSFLEVYDMARTKASEVEDE